MNASLPTDSRPSANGWSPPIADDAGFDREFSVWVNTGRSLPGSGKTVLSRFLPMGIGFHSDN
jgi:hypothetical protein